MVQPSTEIQTRTKLLAAAGELFAEKGFDAVTIREICSRAGANVAAVNYHFKDKQSLYREVVLSIAQFAERAAMASREGPPETQLREFIKQYLHGLLGDGRPAWVMRLMQREMANPTAALKHLVDTVVKPTELRVRDIVAQILDRDPDDESVRLCTHSIIGQCLHYKHAIPVFKHLWPNLWKEPNRLDILADHIATFTLSALRYMANDSRRKSRRSTNGRAS